MATPRTADPDMTLAALEGLRDSGRLAVHMWEDEKGQVLNPFLAPRLAHRWLQANSEAGPDMDTRLLRQIGGKHPERDLSLFSMSLLPSCRNGARASITPYGVMDVEQGFAGYLCDLDQRADAPARVVLAQSNDAFTPNDPRAKITALEQHGSHAMAYRKALPMRTKTPQALTAFGNEALDGLAAQVSVDANSAGTAWLNEIVAAIGPSHIRAIVVPVYEGQQGTPRQWMAEAAGAVAGLRHLNDGQPLPVVSYQVEGGQKGGFSHWGGTRKEFHGRLLNALRELEAQHIFERGHRDHDDIDLLKAAISERGVLGYRVDAPQHVRLRQLETLEQAMQEGTRGR